ncbi:MAG: transmembrane 220 family protein [Ferruginibacter sp.]
MKVFNITFITLFIIFAALQYNDPDPYIWMPIYLYAAFLCYQAFHKKYKPGLYYIGLAIYAVYAAYLFFDRTGVIHWIKRHNAESIVENMQATNPWIEETREFFGLLILIGVLLLNMWSLGRKGKKKKKKST